MERAWLTPNAAPTGEICIQLLVPAGDDWEAAIRGALALLFDVDNFELFGAYTPEQTAEVYLSKMSQWMAWETCQEIMNVEIGSIVIWPATTIPTGWLECVGQNVLIEDYPALYAVIGVKFGGDGIDDFNLPNLGGRMPIGVDTNHALASTGGAETVTLTEAQMPIHSHVASAHQHAISPASFVAINGGNTPLGSFLKNTGSGVNTSATVASNDSTGGGEAHENLPPYLALKYIIYAGV